MIFRISSCFISSSFTQNIRQLSINIIRNDTGYDRFIPMIATSTEIEYFIESFQTRHISKAAIRLGVSQPTLTQSLQKLEQKLNAKLFFRTKQGVVPTELGTQFYAKANALRDCW